MLILEYHFAPSWLTYNYMAQFQYAQHIVTRGAIRDIHKLVVDKIE